MQRIVLASSNVGKLQEIREMLSGLPYEWIPQSEFNIVDAEETGKTFIENALLKARHAALHSGLPALADDSGLVVPALGGAPGVYSARYAGPDANNTQRIQKLLQAMTDIHGSLRRASFYSVLALVQHPDDPTPIVCEGEWVGEILLAPQGNNGFGYDPIFYVPTHGCSAAELDSREKNQISHRAHAMVRLLKRISLEFS